jgi:hypothetical protein
MADQGATIVHELFLTELHEELDGATATYVCALCLDGEDDEEAVDLQ